MLPAVGFEHATYRMISGRATSAPQGLFLPALDIDSLLKVQILTWQNSVRASPERADPEFKIDLHCPYRDVIDLHCPYRDMESPARALTMGTRSTTGTRSIYGPGVDLDLAETAH